jgi:hypothetical protein
VAVEAVLPMLFSFVKTSHITEPYRVAAWVCIGATALARRVSAVAFRLMIGKEARP